MQAPQCAFTTVRSIVAQGPRAERVWWYRCVGPLLLLVGRQPTAAVLPSRLYSTMAYTAYYTRRADSTNSSGGCPHADGGSTPNGHSKAPQRWLFFSALLAGRCSRPQLHQPAFLSRRPAGPLLPLLLRHRFRLPLVLTHPPPLGRSGGHLAQPIRHCHVIAGQQQQW